MPLRLNVGLSKKMGMPNYGSVGANCSLELELDHTLLQNDGHAFQQRVRQAYCACRQAVQEELDHQISSASVVAPLIPAISESTTSRGRRRSKTRPSMMASPRQLNYAQQLAMQVAGLGAEGLERLSLQVAGKPLIELSSPEASGLIEMLREIRDGDVLIDQLLPTEVA